jgi:hypothetical protein
MMFFSVQRIATHARPVVIEMFHSSDATSAHDAKFHVATQTFGASIPLGHVPLQQYAPLSLSK